MSSNGYGHSGRGDLPVARFTVALPAGEAVMEFALLASHVAKAAKELNITPREAMEALRGCGIVDCDEATAEATLALMQPATG